MPSRNRSANACDAASLSPKDTASDFSDIVYAPRHTIPPALAKDEIIARPGALCPAPDAQSFRHSCRRATVANGGAETKELHSFQQCSRCRTFPARARKKSRRCRRLEVLTGRRPTERTQATQCPED